MKRRRRLRRTQAASRARPGILYFLAAMVILAALSYLAEDFRRVPLRLTGSYFWVAALSLSFFFTLLYLAQFILPLGGQEGWMDALRLMIGNFLAPVPGRPGRKGPAVRSSGTALSPSFDQLGAGLVESHQALALARFSSFTRAAGPGFVRLNRGEYVSHVLDLRPHSRAEPVEALTRDGIDLELGVNVQFQIRQTRRPDDPDLPYPYDNDAVFRVSYFSSIGEQEDVLPWSERIGRQAAAELVRLISRRTLDALFRADSPAVEPIFELESELEEHLRHTLAANGIEILSAGIGQFVLPQGVKNKRISLWQADWQRMVEVETAAANAETTLLFMQARAVAQIEMIENIAAKIEALQRTNSDDLSQVITLRLIDALQEATSNANVQALLVPQHLLTTITTMQKWIEEPEQESERP